MIDGRKGGGYFVGNACQCRGKRRNGNVDFVQVLNEEYGAFAAVAEAYFNCKPVAVCWTAGTGVAHLFNGLMDARKERPPGDCDRGRRGSQSDGYVFAGGDESLSVLPGGLPLTARLITPAQAQSVVGMVIRTSIIEKGTTVISVPGDVAAADAAGEPAAISIPAPPVFRPSNSDLSRLMINEARTVAIFGGDGVAMHATR